MTGIDHVALLPGYCAAGTALVALLVDLLVPGRRAAVASATAAGTVATAAVAVIVGRGPVRRTLCSVGCSYVADHRAALVATVFALLTLVVVALSAPSAGQGEYYFLLACSMTGGVVLGYTRDLISLIIAVETLTLPLYPLVAFRRRSAESAEGAVTFFVVSVVSTTVSLLGAALLYASTGALHFSLLAGALQQGHRQPLATTGAVLVIAGLAFKVAAVPMHAWAPAAYDGAPVPVAAYLSTASKLGGVIAILYVAVDALGPELDIVGPALAVVATLTMIVGNLGALRQARMVRLLAWSSVAQAGYILAPLGVLALSRGRTPGAVSTAVAATVGYAVFYVILEIGAFGAVVALRGDRDGGRISDYRGAGRAAPWVAGVFTLSLIGLAGLPPGLAGLFAKVIVVRALLEGGAAWLAIVVAVNAVVGLAYYLRAIGALFAGGPSGEGGQPARARIGWPVAAALGAVALVAVVVGIAPQLVIDAVA